MTICLTGDTLAADHGKTGNYCLLLTQSQRQHAPCTQLSFPPESQGDCPQRAPTLLLQIPPATDRRLETRLRLSDLLGINPRMQGLQGPLSVCPPLPLLGERSTHPMYSLDPKVPPCPAISCMKATS